MDLISTLSCNSVARSASIGLILYAILLNYEVGDNMEFTLSVFVALLSFALHTFHSRLCKEGYGNTHLNYANLGVSSPTSTATTRPTVGFQGVPESLPRGQISPDYDSCRTDGVTGYDSPGYYLLNNGGQYSGNGVSHDQINDVIKKSKLNDVYHQHANVHQEELDKHVYFGKSRFPLYFEPTYGLH